MILEQKYHDEGRRVAALMARRYGKFATLLAAIKCVWHLYQYDWCYKIARWAVRRLLRNPVLTPEGRQTLREVEDGLYRRQGALKEIETFVVELAAGESE